MSLLRRSSLIQLKRINDIVEKDKKKSKKSKKEKANNLIKINNPIMTKIDTYEDFVGESKKDDIKSNDMLDSSRTEAKGRTTIRNMETSPNHTSMKDPRQFLTAGKYIEVGDIKGNINRIDGNFVYIEVFGTLEIKKVSLSKALKANKVEKQKTTVSDIKLTGPNNPSDAKIPKEDKTKVKDLTNKSKKAPDQKISDKTTKEKHIKMFEEFETKIDEYYIAWSSIFDSEVKYDIEKFKEIIGDMVTNMHIEPQFGMSNQPDVLVFELGNYGEARLNGVEKALNTEFETQWIRTDKKDW